jgi:hypothetical protein
MLLSTAFLFAALHAQFVLSTLTHVTPSTKPSKPSTKPTVYFIRHGEKPDSDDEDGLSTDGVKRAQCLRDVFSVNSTFNIGHIIAQKPASGTPVPPSPPKEPT